MSKEQAINIAVSCVMASMLDYDTTQEVIKVLRDLEGESE